MKMKELKDTIPMMTSSDYRERMKAEYMQLEIRIFKLKNFIRKKKETEDYPIEILERQLSAMIDYMMILHFRADCDGFTLEEAYD